MSNLPTWPALSLLRHGVPMTLLLDLARCPDSRELLESERVGCSPPPGQGPSWRARA